MIVSTVRSRSVTTNDRLDAHFFTSRVDSAPPPAAPFTLWGTGLPSVVVTAARNSPLARSSPSTVALALNRQKTPLTLHGGARCMFYFS